MKLFQSSVFRAICAIAIGVLLIMYPDNTVTGITIAIGVLFLVSGLVSCLTYLQARRHAGEYKVYDAEGRQIAGFMPSFPLVGIGSVILGTLLALTPTAFVSTLMYIIGILLILGAIGLFWGLVGARRFGGVGLGYWILPTIVVVVGLYVIVKPMAPVNMAMLVLGWCTLLYGIAELLNAIRFYVGRKRLERQQTTNGADAPAEYELLED